MAELILGRDTSFVNLLKFSFARDPKHIFACDGAYLVKRAEIEREEMEAMGWLVLTNVNEEEKMYQVYICLDRPVSRVMVKAKINAKIREIEEKRQSVIGIYERKIASLTEFKGSL